MSGAVIAIDPGYAKRGKGCACAMLDGGELVSVWYARPGHWARGDIDERAAFVEHDVHRVIVEQPQQDGRSWDIPPSVLMRLSWDGALLAGLYAGALGAAVIPRTPSAWKGSTPKPVQHCALWDLLTVHERALLGGPETEKRLLAARRKGALERWRKPGASYYPSSFHEHNLLDAVALGAIEIGRMKKQ